MNNIKIIAALGVLAAATAGTAHAQAQSPQQSVTKLERSMRDMANRLGSEKLDPNQARPIYEGKLSVDPKKDPWRPVTSEWMAQQTQHDPYLHKNSFSTRVAVDYNGDGHIDAAQMYQNSKQAAVIVTFGGPKPNPPAIVFKTDVKFGGGEEIVAAGRNRILLSIPDAAAYLLFMDRTGPKLISYGE